MKWVALALVEIIVLSSLVAGLGSAYALGKLEAIRASKKSIDGQANMLILSIVAFVLFSAVGIWIALAG